MRGTHNGSRLREFAYAFYLGLGILMLLLVVLMIEGSVLGAIASLIFSLWFLAPLGALVVVMWCISVLASIKGKDVRLSVLWGGAVVYAVVVGLVPFWGTLVYGTSCCLVAARCLAEIRSSRIEHLPWA